jgi:hypothetical protein
MAEHEIGARHVAAVDFAGDDAEPLPAGMVPI